MNAQAPQVDDSERPRAESPRGAIKFTYSSGSRPLEGYTIKRGVGRGGFGEVYFATSDAGKEVALKLIRRNLDVELRGVTQCLNLKHPNLISLYDIRTDEMGDQWVVMEYVSGESLEEVVDRSPNGLPVEQVLWWMRGLCAGVAYLHDHGIVHRDLKPGNIFSDEGTVKIGDYGLAKFISCSRRSGQTESVGTVHYMAPEIANGRYGREIDTYALGIILFEMLTGHVPFEGESVGEVLMKHLTAEPNLDALQEPYREIVRRALAKDPNARIKSVGELIAMLPTTPGEPTTYFARPDVVDVKLDPVAAGAKPANPQPQPRSAAPNANATARDGWEQAKRVVADADKRVLQTAYGSGTPEEPIWKAIRDGLAYVRRRWRGDGAPELSGIQKVILIVAIVWLFSAISGTLVSRNGSSPPLALQLLLIYGVYYVVWVSFIRPGLARHHANQSGSNPSGPPQVYTVPAAASADAQHTVAWNPASNATAPSISRYEEKQRRRRARTNWRELVNQQLVAKPIRQKMTELLGSMLLAAVFASTAALVVPLFGVADDRQPSEAFAAYLWLAMVGTLGSWAVLVPSKFVEGKLEDQGPMRIMLMLLGAIVGIGAWSVAESLFIRMPGMREPINVGSGLISNGLLNWPRITDGSNPSCAVYVAYFSFLFLVPRWWRQTEFTRTSRLSLWWVFVCVFWAWALQLFWWFPQPVGMIVAAVISLSTQLATPWMPPSQRRAISEASKQAVTS